MTPIIKLEIVVNPKSVANTSRMVGKMEISIITAIAHIHTIEYFIGNFFFLMQTNIISNHIIENINNAILRFNPIISPSFQQVISIL